MCVKHLFRVFVADEPLKKPVPLHEQTVKDEKGRYQRFHGAFTGGFSAGYFNTVGTKEGQCCSIRTPAESPSVWSGSVVIQFPACYILCCSRRILCLCSLQLKPSHVQTWSVWMWTNLVLVVALGWSPSTFLSSRQQKAEKHDARPEDFMDEEVQERFTFEIMTLKLCVEWRRIYSLFSIFTKKQQNKLLTALSWLSTNYWGDVAVANIS